MEDGSKKGSSRFFGKKDATIETTGDLESSQSMKPVRKGSLLFKKTGEDQEGEGRGSSKKNETDAARQGSTTEPNLRSSTKINFFKKSAESQPAQVEANETQKSPKKTTFFTPKEKEIPIASASESPIAARKKKSNFSLLVHMKGSVTIFFFCVFCNRLFKVGKWLGKGPVSLSDVPKKPLSEQAQNLIEKAFTGIDEEVFDYHTHLFGTGCCSNCYVINADERYQLFFIFLFLI